MDKQRFYRTSRYDFVVAAAILALSFGSLFAFKNISADNKEAFIYKNGKLIEKINLSQARVVNIDKMKIEVKEGRVRVLESECPHQICKHGGWIARPVQTIVCVPNKILIEIAGTQKDTDYNAISY